MGFQNLLLKKNNFDYFFQKMGFCRFFRRSTPQHTPSILEFSQHTPTLNTSLERATQNKNTFEELISLALFVFWQSAIEKRQKTEKNRDFKKFFKIFFLIHQSIYYYIS